MSLALRSRGILAGGEEVEYPSTLADLAFWYDAADPASLTVSGGRVDAWADKGPHGRHLVSTGTARPYYDGRQRGPNGAPSPAFAGSQALTFSAGADSIDINPWTLVAFFQDSTGGSSFARLFSARVLAAGGLDYSGSAIPLYRDGNSYRTIAVGTSGTVAAVFGIPTLAGSRETGAALSVFNAAGFSAPVGSAGPPLLAYLRMGAACYNGAPPSIAEGWLGQVSEVVCVNASLSDGDVALLNAYLLDKWTTPAQGSATFLAGGASGSTGGLFWYLGTAGGVNPWSNPHTSGAVTLTGVPFDSGHVLANAVDRSSTTQYATAANPGVLTVDLGASRLFSPTQVHFQQRETFWQLTDFTVEGSVNGSAWTTLLDVPSNPFLFNKQWLTFDLTPGVPYRYFRISNNGTLGFQEFEFSGTIS